jgi:hypothetical protein
MRLYIDGVLDSSLATSITVGSNNAELLIGQGYAGREAGKPRARFEGRIDEVRLSSIVRPSFTTSAYETNPQTISLASNVREAGVWHWDTFSDTSLPDGGSITYRLSNDGGTTWLYWDGSQWSISSSTAQANSQAIVDAHINEFPVTFSGLRWQAILSGDGTQQVGIDGISAEATSDVIVPTANPTNIHAYVANGGDAISDGDWTNGSSPYFTWDAGNDDESGIYGYCVYVGADMSADPITTQGLLGISPIDTGGKCAFIVNSTSLDLATPGYLNTPLSSSTSNYYLSLRSIDKAGNVTGSSVQFSFKFDNTAPTNPAFITAPSGFINTKAVEMSWPIVGGNAAADDHSGVSGLQYKIGVSGQWYGDSHTGTG